MLTDVGDIVVDPFGGSCVTGEVCERLQRRWLCIDLEANYLRGAKGRFQSAPKEKQLPLVINVEDPENHYKVPMPGLLWNGVVGDRLAIEGGRTRR